MNKSHQALCAAWQNTGGIINSFQIYQMQNGRKTGLNMLLTNTQPLSYHFSHLGVNVFVATCQTPTCFEFSTRVLAPPPRSTGNTDKRAIIVLLFRVLHELLTFLEDLARVPVFFFFFFSASPPILISGQLAARNGGQRRAVDSTISPSHGGAN